MAIKARSSAAVFAAQLTGEVLGLLRNIILARLLGPAEMGVCAILALTLSLLDMLSDIGPDRLLIQAEDGDAPQFQNTAQAILAVRGVISTVLLVLLSYSVAHLLGSPEAQWQVAVIGFILFVRSVQNLDLKRFQRTSRFKPQVIADLSASVAATVTVLCVAPFVRNAWVFVLAGGVQAGVLAIVSHALAERPYRFAYDRGIARRLFIFGWPLALNSLLMFGAMQGDRLIVFASATKADLGRYSVAIQLSLIPVLVLARVVSTLCLPVLSREQSNQAAFNFRLRQAGSLLGSLALAFSLGFLFLGGVVLRVLYGAEYSISPVLLAWLAVMQGIRLLRTLPSIAAMSRADSLNPLISNVLRLLGIAGALVALKMGGGMEAIAAAGSAGELAALVGSILLLHQRHQVESSPLWRTSGWYLAGVGFAGLWLVAGE